MKKTTVKRTTARKTTSRRPRTRRARAPWTRTRRRTPALATTVGTALATLAVTFVVGASWSVRVALVAVVVAFGAAYILLRRRSELSAPSPGAPSTLGAAPSADPTPETPA